MARALALALCAAVALAGAAQARETEQLKARYETRDGPSEWVLTDVSFLTGGELNTLTSTFDYDQFSVYGVVFFASHEAAVIRMESNFQVCTTASRQCVWGINSPSFNTLSGTDKGGRNWEFCGPQNYSC